MDLRHRASSMRRRVTATTSVSFALLSCAVFAACTGSGSATSEELSTDPVELKTASAEAMGAVTSARFSLERSGGPVYLDQAGIIGMNSLEGRFAAPNSAEALIDVTVNGLLNTTVGAVAIDTELWLSNPLTGEFETLPAGFDIDPSSLFSPTEGWQPLIESLQEVQFVGEEAKLDEVRYHLTARAPAEQMKAVTAGLVGRQGDIDLDLWLDPTTALVTDMEFDTEFGGEQSSWVLGLREYGEPVTITDPTLQNE